MLGNNPNKRFIEASEKLDEIAHNVLQPLGDTPAPEDVKARLIAAAKSPETQQAMQTIDETHDHVTEKSLTTYLARRDPYNGKQRADAARNTWGMTDAWTTTAAHDLEALARLEGEIDHAQNTLNREYGVRAPFNEMDIQRGGAEAEAFAAQEYTGRNAAADIVAASLTKQEMHKQAHNFCKYALASTNFKATNPNPEAQATMAEWHEAHADQISRALTTYAARHGKAGFTLQRVEQASKLADFRSLGVGECERPIFVDAEREAKRYTAAATERIAAQTQTRGRSR